MSTIILLSIACGNADTETNKNARQYDFNLFELIGKEMSDKQVKAFMSELGNSDTDDSGKFPHIMFYKGGVELVYSAENNKLETIFLMGQDNNWYQAYEYSLPEDLTWEMTRSEIEAKIGKGEKRKAYRDEIIYMYVNKQFELSYNTGDEENMEAKLKHIMITKFDK
jgi:hypothetical protein